MYVEIGGKRYTYQPDYSTKNQDWKVQAGAAFRFPVRIGNKDCFIKRFTILPSGHELLKQLKSESDSPLPIVYDVVENVEYGQTITYLFLEYIAGDTLEDVIFQRKPFHSRKLTNGVLECLRLIHDKGYWFSDFCEKNIFFDDHRQRYTLIDIDSCEPLAHRPSPMPNTPGYVPGQEFASAVINFFRNKLNKQNFSFEDLTGIQLNLLQLVPLVAKLELFVKATRKSPHFVYKISNFPELHSYIHGKNPNYSKAVFEKVLLNQGNSEYINTLCGLFPSAYGKIFEPKIISFKANPEQIEAGEEVTFSWETANAEQITIKTSGGRLIKANLPTTGVFLVKVQKNERFILTADGISEGINIKLLPSPKIIAFTAPRTDVYFGEKAAIRWEIEGRPKQVILSERDSSGRMVWSKSVALTGTMAVEPLKSNQVYVLDIGNSQKEIQIKASAKPAIFYFKASNKKLTQGQTAELSWSVSNIPTILLYEQKGGKSRNLIGARKANVPSEIIAPQETTSYILEACKGVSHELTITVLIPEIVSFSASATKVRPGENISLSWDIKHTSHGRLLAIDSRGIENVLLDNLSQAGEILVSPTETTNYKLDIVGGQKQIEVIVEKPFSVFGWLHKLWPLMSVILIIIVVLVLRPKRSNLIEISYIPQYEALLDSAEDAVKEDSFFRALNLLDSAQQLQKSNSSIIKDSTKALQLYKKWIVFAESVQHGAEQNKDYALMDIPLNYYSLAYRIKPSPELQARIDECRTKYQQATSK